MGVRIRGPVLEDLLIIDFLQGRSAGEKVRVELHASVTKPTHEASILTL